ncbi:MAG: anaerobic sulfatase maturase [Dehalococcoidales bacterium]|nr:MAG: anaerobic sulfatase maturase [Dehalococcoidales bacterium]
MTTDSEPPTAFQVILEPGGVQCNLACRYCPYPPEERQQKKKPLRMTKTILNTFTRQYIEAQQVPEVTFNWQGGEPLLMGLEFFQQAVDFQLQYRHPEMAVYNTVQTNGLLLDDEWCRFFKANGFLVVIGIDGPEGLHDTTRIDSSGQPTLERVMAGVELLHKYGVEFNTLTNVHPGNVDSPVEIYRFLRDDVKARFMQFIPVVNQEGEKVKEVSVTGRQYGDFLKTIFSEWVRRDVGTVSVDIFDATLAAWAGQPPGVCIFEETCGKALLLEHNGDLYACDYFVEPHHCLGSIKNKRLTEMAISEQQVRFGLAKRDTLPVHCVECQVRFVCHGGCLKNRCLHTPDGEPGLNYLCEGYRDFFSYVGPAMMFMVEELQAERSPTNVMYLIAEQDALLQLSFAGARVNEPCPCGSGLEFKDCHGRKEA